MDWLLVMLGSWHTLKDYLGVLLKRYRHAFLQKTLQTCFAGNTLEGIFNVSQWDRSHTYALCVHEALVRLFLESFISSEFIEETQANDLISRFKDVVFHLCKPEGITQGDALEFYEEFRSCEKELDIILKSNIEKYEQKSANDDEMFHLFRNFMEDFQPYYMMYIAIRSGNWSMRQTSLRMMAKRSFCLVQHCING